MVDQEDLDLAPIVAVDRPRRVQHGDTMFARKARARADLRLEARRQGNREAARDQPELAWRKLLGGCDRGAQFRAELPGEPLQPGMVFTIEPGAYFPEWGGARIEDDAALTAAGAVWLTDVPRFM